MNKRYYISNPASAKGFDEVPEAEFYALIGTEETRPYASDVYRGDIAIEDVPEELREAVQAVVDTKIARYGKYSEREISAEELQAMLTEVL